MRRHAIALGFSLAIMAGCGDGIGPIPADSRWVIELPPEMSRAPDDTLVFHADGTGRRRKWVLDFQTGDPRPGTIDFRWSTATPGVVLIDEIACDPMLGPCPRLNVVAPEDGPRGTTLADFPLDHVARIDGDRLTLHPARGPEPAVHFRRIDR